MLGLRKSGKREKKREDKNEKKNKTAHGVPPRNRRV
jgi:hypothetical protein